MSRILPLLGRVAEFPPFRSGHVKKQPSMSCRPRRRAAQSLLLMVVEFLLASLLLRTAPAASPAVRPELALPLEKLLSPKDYRKYREKPRYKDRIDLFRRALAEHAKNLHTYVDQGKFDRSSEALLEIQALARYALDEPTRESASAKDLRSGQVKKLEIRLRRLLNSLHDYRLASPLEDYTKYDAAIEDLDKLRNMLIEQLFNRAYKDKD